MAQRELTPLAVSVCRVRLAQRLPVRIAIDPTHLPAGTLLAAGMTATIKVHPRAAR